jgi:hypothetical protein
MTSHELLRSWTAIGRPLEPDWPTNRAVMVLAPLGAAIAGAFAAFGPLDRAVAPAAASGAAAVFLGWALGRELAPDHQGAAFGALVLTFAAALVVPGGSLFALFVALVLARLVNRTVGLPARPLDVGLAVGLGMAFAVTSSTPSVAAVAALAFALDMSLPEGEPSRHWPAVASLLVFAAALMVWDRAIPSGLPGADAPADLGLLAAVPESAVVAIASIVQIALAITTLRVRTPLSVCDARSKPLHGSRVRGGMWVVFLLSLALATSGVAGFDDGILLWAAIAGTVLWTLPLTVFRPILRPSTP